MANLKRVYDCDTITEIKEFLSARLDIDVKFVNVDEDDNIYIGRVKCTNLKIERSTHSVNGIKGIPWIILYQKL